MAAVRQLLRDNPGLTDTAIRWGENKQHITVPLYFVCGLPFHDMLPQPEAVEIFRSLIDAGAEVNRLSGNGETPLHGTVSYGELEMTCLLLNADADTEADGGVVENGTPLRLAAFFGMTACALLLREHGAVISDLAVAAGLGDMPELEKRLSHASAGEHGKAFAYACINKPARGYTTSAGTWCWYQ